ncbi:MAG: hypothetical protein LBS77_00370 [Desulfovibrio sp.]|jgi:cytochrome d ubiquinol oxidase subunit I|nr:hypothetical protein [Desulfovibrio sp.]
MDAVTLSRLQFAITMYVGDIFGSLLTIEATLDFFMDPSFWPARTGWKKHLLSIWLVVIASDISTL